MGKSAPQAPPAPDPSTIINTQSTADADAARLQSSLNNVNYSGPQGTVAYSMDSPDRWTQHVQLTPTAQATFDMDQNAQYRAAKTADDQMLRVGNALSQTMDVPTLQTGANIGQLATGYDTGGKIDYGFNPGGAITTTFNQGGPIASSFGNAGAIQSAVGPTYSPFPQGGPVQGPFLSGPTQAPPSVTGGPSPGGLQLSGPMQAAPGAGGGPVATGSRIAGPTGAPPSVTGNPAPNSAASRLAIAQTAGHPHALAQLQAQGITPGRQGAPPQPSPGPTSGPAPSQGGSSPSAQPSAAYAPSANPGPTIDPVAATQYGEYQQAASRLDPQWRQASEQEQASLAAQGLSPNSAAYQNAMTLFSNSKNDAYNQAIFGAIGAGNTEQNTLYGQQLASGQFHNASQQQNYDQLMGRAQFQNSGQLQGYNENLGQAQFRNQAQQQQYGENQGEAQFNNAAQGQANTQNAAAAAFRNQSLGQNWQEQDANAQLANSAAQQGFQDRAYSQELPINEFTALMGQSQVGMPQSAPAQNTQVGIPDVTGAYGLNSKVAEENYQTQMQNYQSGLGGLFNMGSAAISAGFPKLLASDLRLKRDVRKIGQRRDGIGVYRFRYRGHPGWHVGAIAQEVQRIRPDAVQQMHGFLAVDYGRL